MTVKGFDPARNKVYRDRWVAKNPDYDKIRQKTPERRAQERARDHRRRAKRLDIEQARRARMRGAFVEYVDRTEVFRLDNNQCQNCGSGENLTLDHIIPLAKGGLHSYGNVQTLCRSCNCSKGAK